MDKKLQRIHELAAESRRRKMDALRCYRPTPKQQQFHESLAAERIVRGGKRCLAPEQVIYDPVAEHYRVVSEIKEDFHVLAVSPYGVVSVARAKRPFKKGRDAVYRVSFSNGRVVCIGSGHCAFDGTSFGPLRCLERLPVVPTRVGQQWLLPWSNQDSVGISEPCMQTAARESEVFGLQAGTHVALFSHQYASQCGEPPYPSAQVVHQHHGLKEAACEAESQDIPSGLSWVTVNSVRYERHDDIWDFEVPAYDNYVMGGVLHHNSGKTVCCSAEFASAVTGLPIIKSNGEPIPRKYPKDNMLCWIIGYDLRHLGSTIYRVLFDSGYFKIVQNSDGTWRTLNPANPDDMKLMDVAKPAGPMIPERSIVPNSWSWENKADHCFRSVVVKHPWGVAKIEAFPSTALQPKQGDAVDLIWIDEDIRFSHHVQEYQDRLADKKGRMIWSAWPHGTNDALVEMSQRAAEQAEEENPDVFEIVLRFSDNPFIDDDEKRKSVARMRTEEERRSRDYGEFLLDSIAMYEFIPAVHGVHKIVEDDPYYAEMYSKDALNRIYTKHGKFPDDWTRYLSLDPSHTRSAVLFAVVPPPSEFPCERGRIIIVEDELILKKHSASELAAAVAEKVQGRRYEAFIIDHNASRQTSIGMSVGQSIGTLYEASFAEHGIKARLTGSGFIPGNNKVEPRCMEVREYLRPDSSGVPSLRFVIDKTYHTQKEFNTYRKKLVFDEILDTPANARTHDAMSALEYLVSYIYHCEQAYVDPTTFQKKSPAYRRAMKMKQKWQEKHDGDYCHIGPGSSAFS